MTTRQAKSKLRIWNGRGFDCRGDSLHIAAKSRRAAARMVAEAQNTFKKLNVEINERAVGQWDREIQVYFSECWGNSMDGITPTEGVWYQEKWNDKPRKIWPCLQGEQSLSTKKN